MSFGSPLPNGNSWKFVARFLGTAGFLLMLLIACMYFSYADTRPTIAEEKTGQIYPLNVHGRIVYLTGKEKSQLNAIDGLTVGVIISFVGVVCYRPNRPWDSAEGN